MTEDEKLHQIGTEAEGFIKFVEENKYYSEVLADIQKGIVDTMIGLRPWQKDEFSMLKSQLECLYAPINRVRTDVELGKQAFDRLNGVNKEEGLL